MLDVHPAHERISGFRDFFLHLLTITIGLLIALGLEGCVEWAHHRHLRIEADANLHQELRDNQKALSNALTSSKGEREELLTIVKFLERRRNNQHYDGHELTINFSIAGLRDASWHTASATGALSLMEYQHVQHYSEAYLIQNQFTTVQSQTLDGVLQLQSYFQYGFDPNKFPPAEAEAALKDVQRTLAHLLAMEQIGASVNNAYEEALAAK